jgi:hypothetical protein
VGGSDALRRATLPNFRKIFRPGFFRYFAGEISMLENENRLLAVCTLLSAEYVRHRSAIDEGRIRNAIGIVLEIEEQLAALAEAEGKHGNVFTRAKAYLPSAPIMRHPIDKPIRALEDVLYPYIARPCTRELAEAIVADVLAWAKEFDVEVKVEPKAGPA